MSLEIASFVLGIIGIIIAVWRLWIAFYPIQTERMNRLLLNDRLSRGPYDKTTIDQATRYYIRPKCTSFDPTQLQDLHQGMTIDRNDLFSEVDEFLDEKQGVKHLLVLADSGMGKTSFVLNYYAHNLRRIKRKQSNIVLVYLGAKNADEVVNQVADKEGTNVILDALDEDIKAINDYEQRIYEILQLCSDFRRIIITCRSQFFPTDKSIPIETHVKKLGPRSAGDTGIYEFKKLYLFPFDTEEIGKYLNRRYPVWRINQRRKARKLVDMMPLLSVRPMLLSHIPDLLLSESEPQYAYELYEQMVDAWLERERYWVDKRKLRTFSEHLAVELYNNRTTRGAERIPLEEVATLASRWDIPLENWQISSRSLLNRDALGNYKFAHRSILEYLYFVQLLAGNQTCLEGTLTDQMQQFVVEFIDNGKTYPLAQFGTVDSANSISRTGLFIMAVWCIKKWGQRHLFSQYPRDRLDELDNELWREVSKLTTTNSVDEANESLEKLIRSCLAYKDTMLGKADEIVSIFRVDPSNPDNLNLWWYSGKTDLLTHGFVFPIDDDLVGRVFQRKMGIMIKDVWNMPPSGYPFDSRFKSTRSIAAFPILRCNELTSIGVVSWASTRKNIFSDSDALVFELIASRLAVILETHAQLLRSIQSLD